VPNWASSKKAQEETCAKLVFEIKNKEGMTPEQMTTDVLTLAALDDFKMAVGRDRRFTQQGIRDRSKSPALLKTDSDRSFNDAKKNTLPAAELEQLVSKL
jgi:hypothetical protein